MTALGGHFSNATQCFMVAFTTSLLTALANFGGPQIPQLNYQTFNYKLAQLYEYNMNHQVSITN